MLSIGHLTALVTAEGVTAMGVALAAESKPDPLQANSVTEFIAQLRVLHVWTGEPSLREMSRHCEEEFEEVIAHTTFATMFSHPRLPTQRTITLFVRALGCDEDDVRNWTSAWRKLRYMQIFKCEPMPGLASS